MPIEVRANNAPDGGYVIYDHGCYALVEEYIRANELNAAFVEACGGPAPYTAGFVRLDHSLNLERRPLHEYRRAIDSAGWASAQRRYVSGDPSITYQAVRPIRRAEIIEAMLSYGYGDADNAGEWVAELDYCHA